MNDGISRREVLTALGAGVVAGCTGDEDGGSNSQTPATDTDAESTTSAPTSRTEEVTVSSNPTTDYETTETVSIDTATPTAEPSRFARDEGEGVLERAAAFHFPADQFGRNRKFYFAGVDHNNQRKSLSYCGRQLNSNSFSLQTNGVLSTQKLEGLFRTGQQNVWITQSGMKNDLISRLADRGWTPEYGEEGVTVLTGEDKLDFVSIEENEREDAAAAVFDDFIIYTDTGFIKVNNPIEQVERSLQGYLNNSNIIHEGGELHGYYTDPESVFQRKNPAGFQCNPIGYTDMEFNDPSRYYLEEDRQPNTVIDSHLDDEFETLTIIESMTDEEGIQEQEVLAEKDIYDSGVLLGTGITRRFSDIRDKNKWNREKLCKQYQTPS